MVAQPVTPPPAPAGYQMGAMNDITELLARATLSGPQRRFLEIVQRKSFGMAFIQRKQGYTHPGTSCRYERSKWAQTYDWDSSQLKRVRDQLIQLGILWFTPAKEGRYQQEGEIGFSLVFETWLPLQDAYRATQRQKHARRGTGRPKGDRQTQTNAGNSKDGEDVFFDAFEDGPGDISTTDQGILPEGSDHIPWSVADPHEAASDECSHEPVGISTLEDTIRGETDADASGALRATIAASPSAPPLRALKKRPHQGEQQRLCGATKRDTPHPPVARTPRSPLPERWENEQQHAYWQRALTAVQSQQHARKQQQYVVNACAHDLFAWPLAEGGQLNAEDCQLLARLQRAAGSWGTVMHWLFVCEREARDDVRGYLHGCARRPSPQIQVSSLPEGAQEHDENSAAAGIFPEGGQARRQRQQPSLVSDAVPTARIGVDRGPTEQFAYQLQQRICRQGTVAGREFMMQLGITDREERRALFLALAQKVIAKGFPVERALGVVRDICDSAITGRKGLQSNATTRAEALRLLDEQLRHYPDVRSSLDEAGADLLQGFCATGAGAQAEQDVLAMPAEEISAFFVDAVTLMDQHGVLPSQQVERLQNVMTMARVCLSNASEPDLRVEVLRRLGQPLN